MVADQGGRLVVHGGFYCIIFVYEVVARSNAWNVIFLKVLN